MAKIEILAGVVRLHGKLGQVCFRTMKNGQVVMCRTPMRTKPFTEAQKRQQERFKRVVKKTNELMLNEDMLEVLRQMFYKNRSKYKTLRAYVFHCVNEMYPK